MLIKNTRCYRLVTTTIPNTKISEIENIIPKVSGLLKKNRL